MEDTTTTVDSSQDYSSEDTSQLEQAVDNAAEVATEETQTDPSASDSESSDEDITWLRNKGLDPSDPDFARKAAQLARNTEREFHKTRQEAKNQLQEAATASVEEDEYDPTAARLQVLETRIAVQDFYSNHPDARDMDADMAKIVQAKPYLAQDLEAVYAIAKSTKYEAELKAAENKGRTEAKSAIARQSTASMPQGNASDSTPVPKLTRQAIADMTQQEYESRRDEINAAIASGQLK